MGVDVGSEERASPAEQLEQGMGQSRTGPPGLSVRGVGEGADGERHVCGTHLQGASLSLGQVTAPVPRSP